MKVTKKEIDSAAASYCVGVAGATGETLQTIAEAFRSGAEWYARHYYNGVRNEQIAKDFRYLCAAIGCVEKDIEAMLQNRKNRKVVANRIAVVYGLLCRGHNKEDVADLFNIRVSQVLNYKRLCEAKTKLGKELEENIKDLAIFI